MSARRERGQEFSKGKRELKLKAQILIFAEGKTELIYLQNYQKRPYNINIVPIEPGHTDALGIVRFAKEYIKSNPLDLELGDRAYCVFDADPESNVKANLAEAVNMGRGNGAKGLEIIFSNPCIEAWFYFHFSTPPAGKDAKEMKTALNGKMKTILKENHIRHYTEKTDVFPLLIDRQPTAITNTRRHDEEMRKIHSKVFSHECNPYTNMFELVEYIVKMGGIEEECCR